MHRAAAHWLHRTFWSAYGRTAWDRQREPWREAQIDSVVRAVASAVDADSAHVLDVGCGTGRYAEALARAGLTATGIDYADGMVEIATAKCGEFPEGQLQFQQAESKRPTSL